MKKIMKKNKKATESNTRYFRHNVHIVAVMRARLYDLRK